MEAIDADANGSVQIFDLPPIDDHPAGEQVIQRWLYTWSPPGLLTPKLPADYSVALECWLCRDGVRRFSPADPRRRDFTGYCTYDPNAFVLETSVGGRGLIWARGEHSPYPTLSFEEARLLFLYAHHMREHLGATRKLGSAINLARSGRRTPDERDALPPDIGLHTNGSGERWNVRRLKEQGLRLAKFREIESPTEDDIVRLGLLVAAAENPLDITDEECEFITRSVIYRMNSDLPTPTVDQVSFVAGCLTRSIAKREDDSVEEFRSWIEDPHSDLIRSIQRASGDQLSREQIRAALLDLAWQSVKVIGHCVDTQMRAFREALPESLSTTENYLFEQCFLSNPVIGGLPLIIMHDRFDFLREIVPELWSAPHDESWTMGLRTMLYYYGVIVGNLRDADVAIKRRKTSIGTGGFVPAELIDFEQLAKSKSSEPNVVAEAAREIAVLRGYLPRVARDLWQVRVAKFDKSKVDIELCDPNGEKCRQFRVSRLEFDGLVKRLHCQENL